MDIPYIVYFDENEKALMARAVIGGLEYNYVLYKANEIDSIGNVYSEECLRDAAKRYNN